VAGDEAELEGVRNLGHGYAAPEADRCESPRLRISLLARLPCSDGLEPVDVGKPGKGEGDPGQRRDFYELVDEEPHAPFALEAEEAAPEEDEARDDDREDLGDAKVKVVHRQLHPLAHARITERC
jgi:hypothetical protein